MQNKLSKTYYIAICDDDEAYIQYVKKLFLHIREAEEDFVFYEYLSGEELLKDIVCKERCDLLFLDVQLKGIDGNATAKTFRNEFPDALLVFCSGVYFPTTESFESTPFRYLLKSYTDERMTHELEQVCSKMRKKQQIPILFGKRNHRNFRIHPVQVQYIEIAKRGSVIHTFEEGECFAYSSNLKVNEYYEKLCDFGFIYAHNSYIVNLNAISVVTLTEIELISGEMLTVSRSQSKEFREKFAAYLSQKY